MTSSYRSIAALSLGLSSLFIASCGTQDRPAGAVARLIETTGVRRPVAGRLSGGAGYAPCAGRAGGLDDDGDACQVSRPSGEAEVRRWTEALGRIQSQAARMPRVAAWHTLGLAVLITGGDPDAGIRYLAAAAAVPGRDAAAAASDLAAAYLARAGRRRDPADLLRALEAVDRAVGTRPAMTEALFNRALILEHLYLANAARDAWAAYRRVDRSSGWAAEAAEHLRRLNGGVRVAPAAMRWRDADRQSGLATAVAADPKLAREYVEQDLLGRWAEATLAGQRRLAGRLLAQAQAIADVLAGRGEQLAGEAVGAIAAAGRAGDRARLADLAVGHRAFCAGHALFTAFQPQAALAQMELAGQRLRHAASPFALRADFFAACCLYHLDRFDDALARLERLRRSLVGHASPALAGHLGWMAALLHVVRGELPVAAGLYVQAQSSFAAVGEEENVVSLHVLIAETLDLLGRRREAWQHRFQVMRQASGLRDPRMLNEALQVMAHSALLDRQLTLASYLQDEVVADAVATGVPEMTADAFYWRAVIRGHRGAVGAALMDLDQAKQQAQRQGDSLFRQRTMADIQWGEGSLLSESNPPLAVPLLSSAIRYYTSIHHLLHVLQARLARAHCYRLMAQPERAAEDLRAALDAYEALGSGLVVREQVFAFHAREQDLFDEMIALEQQDERRPERAFAYAERARNRIHPGLNGAVGLSAGERSSLQRLQGAQLDMDALVRRMPAGTAVVEYSLQADRIYIWVVTRRGLRSYGSSLDPVRLPMLLDDLRAEMRGERQHDASTTLYQALIHPWIGDLPAAANLVFVPDKALRQVPFACLRPAPGSRYLIEEHGIEVAPSASAYVLGLGRRPPPWHSGEPVLVVGDPAVAPAWGLPPLSEAGQEAQAVAAVYGPQAQVLLGAAATRDRFLQLAVAASVVHFAGHAKLDSRTPLFSALLLAPSTAPGDAGAVTTRDLYRLDLRRTRVVVLSSCEAASGEGADREGVTDLARAFLAAGVEAVVASLWKVDDSAAIDSLMVSLHRRLAAGELPAAALRAAQLEMLHCQGSNSHQDASWAGFTVIGSAAP